MSEVPHCWLLWGRLYTSLRQKSLLNWDERFLPNPGFVNRFLASPRQLPSLVPIQKLLTHASSVCGKEQRRVICAYGSYFWQKNKGGLVWKAGCRTAQADKPWWEWHSLNQKWQELNEPGVDLSPSTPLPAPLPCCIADPAVQSNINSH